MENGTSHVLHAIILTSLLYAIMHYVCKQSSNIAIDRSILIGTVVLLYMILYGHQFPPTKLNPNIF
jgi:hypothetical protein